MEGRDGQQERRRDAAPPDKSDHETAPRPPKRRRWLRVLLVVLAGLTLLVLAAPYLISTDLGTAAVVSIANSQLRGHIAIEDLSLGWAGPSTIRGLEVIDDQGRQVLHAARIEWSAGTWRGIISALDFGQVTVDSPSVLVYVQEDGGVSIAEALSPRTPRPKTDKPLPELFGQITLANGQAEVILTDGQVLKVPRLSGQIDLATLSRIGGHFELEPPGGGLITADVDLDQLVADGKLSAEKANGTVSLQVTEAVQIGPIMQAIAGERGVQGQATMNAVVTFRDGRIEAEYDSQVQGLRTAGEGLQPIDVAAKLRATTKDRRVLVRAEVSGQPGRVTLDATYPLGAQARRQDGRTMLGAMLRGEGVSLPEVELDAAGEVDLPLLARAVPVLLSLRPDVQLTGGTLTIENVSLRGGVRPLTQGSIRLSELTASRAGRPVRVEPMSASWQASLEEGTGLLLERLALRAPFGEFVAFGSSERVIAEWAADLAAAHQQLSGVFDLGDLTMAGSVGGEATLERIGEDRIGIRSSGAVSALRLEQGGKPVIVIDAASFREDEAQLMLKDGKLAQAVWSEATLEVDGTLSVKSSGQVDWPGGAMNVQAHGSLEDVAAAARWVSPAQTESLARYGGNVAFTMQIARAAGDAALTSQGEVRAAGLSVDGKRIEDGKALLRWNGVKLGPRDGQVELAAVTFDGLGASASAESVKADLSDEPVMDGRLGVRADLTPLTSALSAIARRENPPPVTGTLDWQAELATRDGVVHLDGGGQVDELTVRGEQRVYREPQLRFAHDVSMDTSRQHIDVKDVSVDSRALRARAGGTVSDYRGKMLLDLKGHYEGDWSDLFVLINELAPQTKGVIVLAGKTEDEFTVTGPARQPEVKPTYHGVGADADVSWASGELEGLQLGAATLQPAMAGGTVTLPVTEVTASGGVMRLGGVVDLREAEPVYRLPGRVDVLENVQINRQFARDVMSRVNPIFADVVSIEGTVSLTLEDMDLPLGESIKTAGRGGGHLDLSKMKVQPSGILAELLKLSSAAGGESSEMALSQVDFVIRDGRVEYDNFVMQVGDYDLRFHGSVGFDNTLDLMVSVPVRPALLRRLGVGAIGEYAELLEGLRVDIPVAGSRLSPRLDLTKVNIPAITKQLRERLLRKEAGSILGDLLDRREAPPAKPRQMPSGDAGELSPPPASQPGARAVERLLEGLLQEIDRPTRAQPKE